MEEIRKRVRKNKNVEFFCLLNSATKNMNVHDYKKKVQMEYIMHYVRNGKRNERGWVVTKNEIC